MNMGSRWLGPRWLGADLTRDYFQTGAEVVVGPTWLGAEVTRGRVGSGAEVSDFLSEPEFYGELIFLIILGK